ncbi:rRNA maturation RNase YbeY [Rhodovulum sp. YNF3179]|uniref:rRNA maturation RNase YbeY n=1 Tax=Rhodovulum sp. YNF3179 TaxID=3425127 RepID=UPI003D352DE7
MTGISAAMDDLVDAVVEDDRWTATDLEALAAQACAAALRECGYDPAGFEIGLLACDDGRIAALNADFRDRARPTNVLSWPAQHLVADAPGAVPPGPAADPFDARTHLGDIAIAYDTVAREAAAQGKAVADHCRHLLVHGTLHLLGYDHISEKDALLMEGVERRALATLGVADPY